MSQTERKGNKKIFRSCVYVGIANGKPIKKTVRAGSQRELNAKVKKLKAQIEAGKNVYEKALFGTWAEKWLRELKIPSGISAGTITQYKSAIKHLCSRFEFVELKDITLSDFQQFITDLYAENPITNKHTSKRTLESIKKVASSIFGYARANNVAGVPDFFHSVVIPKNAPVMKRRALDEREQSWIIETPHRAQLPAMVMLFSGLRRGEVIPLRWNDIDLEGARIRVSKSVEIESNVAMVKEGGKSGNAIRTIPIPPILVRFLADQKKLVGAAPFDLVCKTAGGKLHTKSSWRKMWDSYLLNLNLKYGYHGRIKKNDPKTKCATLPLLIPKITPHYLRHTFATLLYLQGIDVVTAKQILGHADIQTTVNIYTDLEHFNRAALSDEYRERLATDLKITA